MRKGNTLLALTISGWRFESPKQSSSILEMVLNVGEAHLYSLRGHEHVNVKAGKTFGKRT